MLEALNALNVADLPLDEDRRYMGIRRRLGELHDKLTGLDDKKHRAKARARKRGKNKRSDGQPRQRNPGPKTKWPELTRKERARMYYAREMYNKSMTATVPRAEGKWGAELDAFQKLNDERAARRREAHGQRANAYRNSM